MDQLSQGVKDALAFEQSNWANGDIDGISFYQSPPFSPECQPGTLLRLEESTDTSKYLLPPGLALSRFIYLSELHTGGLVPVSGFVLWPYAPRKQPDGGFAIAAWAHGTSGWCPTDAPSNHSSLWQHFLGPYNLAQQGYVVVATDYVGLGVAHFPDGRPIVHPYLVTASQAADVSCSVAAARAAFPVLSADWIAIGHSQGGGAAWGVAERQVRKPVGNLLGSVPVAPATRLCDEGEPFGPLIAVVMAPSLKHYSPQVDLSGYLTADGEKYAAMVGQKRAGIASATILLTGAGVPLVKPDWRQNKDVINHVAQGSAGGKQLACPLLVIHGDIDATLQLEGARKAVALTMAAFPESQIRFVTLPGMGHAPAMMASQCLFAGWIADRFAGKTVEEATGEEVVQAHARPLEAYRADQSFYLMPATEFYQVP